MNLPVFLIHTAERRRDRTATQWAGESALENSAVAACTAAARDRRRVMQEMSFNSNLQLYCRSQGERKRPNEYIRNI